ncbi:MAG: hypothetical protein L6Q57_00980 [Alphaproteobacteria bacterium]|nr:hypothetical protein [Alphaproteobacteria bacterium]
MTQHEIICNNVAQRKKGVLFMRNDWNRTRHRRVWPVRGHGSPYLPGSLNYIDSKDTGSRDLDLPFLGVVKAFINIGDRKVKCGFLIWGRYYDEGGNLRAIDCFKVHQKSLSYPSEMLLPPDLVPGAQSVDTGVCYYLSIGDIIPPAKFISLDPKYTPDLVIRRAGSVAFDFKNQQDAGRFKQENSFMRLGIQFPHELTTTNPGRRSSTFLPELNTAITHIEWPNPPLTPEEIKNICELGVATKMKHIEDGTRVVYPPTGTYPNWPEDLLKHGAQIGSFGNSCILPQEPAA